MSLEQRHCPICFIEYAAPATLIAARRQDGKSFYCPQGHELVFRDSDYDRIRRERDQLKQEAARLAEEAEFQRRIAAAARDARKAAERSAAAARGQVTKLKNRASAGVCPCCNRSIRQLALHMKTKHPEFVAENVVHFAARSKEDTP